MGNGIIMESKSQTGNLRKFITSYYIRNKKDVIFHGEACLEDLMPRFFHKKRIEWLKLPIREQAKYKRLTQWILHSISFSTDQSSSVFPILCTVELDFRFSYKRDCARAGGPT